MVYDASVAAEAEKKLAPKTRPITKDLALKVGAEVFKHFISID